MFVGIRKLSKSIIYQIIYIHFIQFIVKQNQFSYRLNTHVGILKTSITKLYKIYRKFIHTF